MSAMLNYVLTDVFTAQAFGGNPLAVFLDPGDLPTAAMQLIARELNLSETTFVFPPPPGEDGYTVRIFTPLSELPFAGHPTVGTALVLDAVSGNPQDPKSDYTLLLHEQVGPVPVRITRDDDGRAQATLTSPRLPEFIGRIGDARTLAALLGLSDADVVDSGAVRPACFSAGVPFAFIPLRDREALSRARLDGTRWQSLLADSIAPHVYAMTMQDWQEGLTIDARMFAPALGIPEDPATGVAAVALGGYLATVQRMAATRHFAITQGADMGRPSRLNLTVEVQNGQPSRVEVGGSAVIIGRGALDRDLLLRAAA